MCLCEPISRTGHIEEEYCILFSKNIMINYFLKQLFKLCMFLPDPSELPLCEISLACDNLLCDGHGRPPNPVLVVHVYIPTDAVWVKYAKTEVIEVRCLWLWNCILSHGSSFSESTGRRWGSIPGRDIYIFAGCGMALSHKAFSPFGTIGMFLALD